MAANAYCTLMFVITFGSIVTVTIPEVVENGDVMSMDMDMDNRI